MWVSTVGRGDAGFPLLVERLQGSHCCLCGRSAGREQRGSRIHTVGGGDAGSSLLSLANQLVESRGDAGFPLLVEEMQGSHCW